MVKVLSILSSTSQISDMSASDVEDATECQSEIDVQFTLNIALEGTVARTAAERRLTTGYDGSASNLTSQFSSEMSGAASSGNLTEALEDASANSTGFNISAGANATAGSTTETRQTVVEYTRPPTALPTPVPTTRAPTPVPTQAPTSVPTTRAPTPVPTTRVPTPVPTRQPAAAPNAPTTPTTPTTTPVDSPAPPSSSSSSSDGGSSGNDDGNGGGDDDDDDDGGASSAGLVGSGVVFVAFALYIFIRKWRATEKGGVLPVVDEVEIVDRISNGPLLEEGISGTNGKAQEMQAPERVPVPS
jgi:hypothetical protein